MVIVISWGKFGEKIPWIWGYLVDEPRTRSGDLTDLGIFFRDRCNDHGQRIGIKIGI
jgi:hypothetical protein